MSEKKLRYFTIPNLITLLNILSGSIAVLLAIENDSNLTISAYLIGISAILDFLDGMTARLLHSYSEIGKQLDSLADLISFGFAPTAILFQMLKSSQKIQEFSIRLPFLDILILSSSILIVMFSALRLAKFNVDTRQTDSFVGLPTPACAIMVASLPLIMNFDPDKLYILVELLDVKMPFQVMLAIIGFQIFVLESIKFYIPLIFILSFLLVAEFPMFSLKFKNLSFADNKIRYGFIIASVVMLLLIELMAIPFIIILYIVLSAIRNLVIRHRLRMLPFELEDERDEMDDIKVELETEFRLFDEEIVTD